MAEIIDIKELINKRAQKRLDVLKNELEIEFERLDFDIEKEINRYVIFNTSGYYELQQINEQEDASEENILKHLLTAFDMLVKLNHQQPAIELENIITRLENNSY